MEKIRLTGRFHPAASSWPALLTGAAVGALVASEAVLSHASLTSRLVGTALREIGYLTAAVALLLVLVAASCVIWRVQIWRHRAVVVVGLVMLTSHLTAISAGPLNPLVIAILLAVGVWVLDFLAGNGSLSPSVFRTLTILFFAFVLGSTFGAHPSEVFEGVGSFLPKFVIAIVIVELLDERRKVSLAVSAMVWTTGLIAVVGLLQVGAYFFFQIEYSFAEPFYRYTETPFGTFLRASGFSNTAPQFALPIGVACVISIYLALTCAGRRLMFAVLGLVTAGAVGLSVVRGMWVATLAGLLLVPFIVKPRLTPVWVGLAFITFLVALTSGIGNWVYQSVESLTSGASVTERVDLFAAGLKVMFDSVNGTGIYNFGPQSPMIERYPVHNAPIQVGSELGLPGLFVFLAVLAWIGWRLWDAARRCAREDRTLMTALLLGYVSLVIAIQAGPFAFSQFLWIYLGLCEAAARLADPLRPDHV